MPITESKKPQVKRKKLTINKVTLAVATCLSVFQMQTALAACSINPNNSEEHIQSIHLNGTSLSNGDIIKNGDVLTLTPGYYDTAYKDYWSIWIDLNADGDFSDSNEQVFTSSSASNTSVSATLNIPGNATINNGELRVLLHAGDVSDNSCGYDYYGDSQDFSINIDASDNGGGSGGDYALSETPRGGNDEHIFAVEIGNNSHTSGNNDGYADFTNNKTFNISDGDSISLIPTTSWGTNWAIWIDSDNSGNFDSNEEVFTGSGNRDAVVEGTLNLANISEGTARMRIAMNGDGTANADGFTYGEIEDYTVTIGETNADLSKLKNGIAQIISGGDVYKTFEVPGDATSVQIAISPTSSSQGDVDLYVKFGSIPTEESYDCRPYKPGNNETCDLSAKEGTYYIWAKPFSEFADVSLQASYSDEPVPENRWEEDYANVLFYRFEFKDTPFDKTESELKQTFDEVTEYFNGESYGKFDVTFTLHPTIIYIDENKSVYDNDHDAWEELWHAKLLELGVDVYNPGKGNIAAVTAPAIDNRNSLGGPGHLELNEYNSGIIAHEMGHAMGFHHAQGIDGGDTVFGQGDYETERGEFEYGNVFGLMGTQAWTSGAMNLIYKNAFTAWDIKANVPLITTSGTYRIYAFDQGEIGENLGLRIQSGNGEYTYWLEYRTKGDYLNKEGFLLNIEGYWPDDHNKTDYWNTTSYLLDMTPNSLAEDDYWADDWTDAHLVIGKSYTDEWNGFTVTTMGIGGEIGTAEAWIEIAVEMH
ncbi:GEVED domain-containing protein [Colwellia psychrerythraea]|uniref:Peptidase domain protein n=1 Tax=Colwellia psychrerythraea TaxID=28229 RepID=A0A099L3N5_COLPS|nr:GEVED domain-containing protein [Colwellia psychrerythraea]KGJ97554.1 peptidase domain protein [Colwellia psychrerythraea]